MEVDGGGWWTGRPARKKNKYCKNISKTIQYFLLVVSPPSRKSFIKTFSGKNYKKIKKIICQNFEQLFLFSVIFSTFCQRKVYFSKTIPYFFLVVSHPLRRVIKTFSEKNSKKTIFFFQKISNNFFFSDFVDFLRSAVIVIWSIF